MLNIGDYTLHKILVDNLHFCCRNLCQFSIATDKNATFRAGSRLLPSPHISWDENAVGSLDLDTFGSSSAVTPQFVSSEC